MYSKLSILLMCSGTVACSGISISDNKTKSSQPSAFQSNLTTSIKKIEQNRKKAAKILATNPSSQEQREQFYQVMLEVNKEAGDALGFPWKEMDGLNAEDFSRHSSLPKNWRVVYPDLARLSDCGYFVQMAGFEVENLGTHLPGSEEKYFPLLRLSDEPAGRVVNWLNKALQTCDGLSRSVELRELQRQQKSQTNK